MKKVVLPRGQEMPQNTHASIRQREEETQINNICIHVTASTHIIIGPQREKTCLRGFANNTGADQPAHPRSLISAFVIRFLQSIICQLATDEILIF